MAIDLIINLKYSFMRKFVIFVFCSLFAVCISAQEIVSVVRCDCKDGYSKVYLSNGEVLDQGWLNNWILIYPDEYDVTTDLVRGRKYAEGTLVQKTGKLYKLVDLKKVGVYTIDRVRTHTVTAEQAESMAGDFSYRGIFTYRRAEGKIKSSVSGGSRTIVNVYFTNGQYATIEASNDPIWLDAEKGMQVEHYQWSNVNVYKIL